MCWHPFSVTRVALPLLCIFLETYVLASLLCDTGCPPFTVCMCWHPFSVTRVALPLLSGIFLETYVLASLLCDTGCPPFTVCIFLETYVLDIP